MSSIVTYMYRPTDRSDKWTLCMDIATIHATINNKVKCFLLQGSAKHY
jgi:hypothetical protein